MTTSHAHGDEPPCNDERCALNRPKNSATGRILQQADFPITVRCTTCGKSRDLYFNGGELDQFDCCGHCVWVEAIGFTIKTGRVAKDAPVMGNPSDWFTLSPNPSADDEPEIDSMLDVARCFFHGDNRSDDCEPCSRAVVTFDCSGEGPRHRFSATTSSAECPTCGELGIPVG